MGLALDQGRAELLLDPVEVVGVDDLQERLLAELAEVPAEELLLGGARFEPAEAAGAPAG